MQEVTEVQILEIREISDKQIARALERAEKAAAEVETREDRIIKLMEACVKNGVAIFEDDKLRGGIKMEFFHPSRVSPQQDTRPSPENSAPAEEPAVELIVDQDAEDEIELSPEVAEQLRLDELMVADPAAWEQEMIDAHKD